MQNSAEAHQLGFLPRVESLRGVAALTVALMHACGAPWTTAAGAKFSYVQYSDLKIYPGAVSAALSVMANAEAAVNLFFVISGFVLTLSLLRGPQELRPSATRFLVARIFRLYPAIFATVALCTLVFWTTGATVFSNADFTPLNIIQNALLIDKDINGVMWSLQIEVIAIPLIFIGYWIWRWLGLGAFIAFLLLVTALSFHGGWIALVRTPRGLSPFPAFVFGMAAFIVGKKLVETLPAKILPVLFVLAVAGFYASKPVFGVISRWEPVVEAAFGAVIVTLLAYGYLGWIGRLFDHPLIRFYGRISYSFYLLHPLTLIVLYSYPEQIGLLQAHVPDVVLAAGLFVVPTAAITPLAWAVYRWVELPGVAAGRALLGSHRRAPVPSLS